jgi:hypothetical protein
VLHGKIPPRKWRFPGVERECFKEVLSSMDILDSRSTLAATSRTLLTALLHPPRSLKASLSSAVGTWVPTLAIAQPVVDALAARDNWLAAN